MKINIGDRFKNIDGKRTLGCIVEITEIKDLFYVYKVVKTSKYCGKKLARTLCNKQQFKKQFVPAKSTIRKL